jgi:hypothetical protein
MGSLFSALPIGHGNLAQSMDPMSRVGHYTLLGRSDPIYNKSRLGDVAQGPTPYAGVTPTLAAANTGYAVNGPGAVNPMAAAGNSAEALGAPPAAPMNVPGASAAPNPYVAAAQNATKQAPTVNRMWG